MAELIYTVTLTLTILAPITVLWSSYMLLFDNARLGFGLVFVDY